MGKLSRTKGHSFEREIAKRLRGIFPQARRHLEYQDAEANGIDLVMTGKYSIQCKRGRKPAPISKIREVEPKDGQSPLLITQGDRDKIYVVMEFDEFLTLLKESKHE